MAISLKHAFQSAVADGGDTTLVQPSNWNAEHTLTLATGTLLGRTTAGTGSAEEISAGGNLTLSSGTLNANVGLGANTFTGAQTIGNGTLTASAPVLDLSQTWNNAGVTFTGIKANVTDTASAAASLLLDLQVGAASKFSVQKTGTVSARTNSDNIAYVLPDVSTTTGFGVDSTRPAIFFLGQSYLRFSSAQVQTQYSYAMGANSTTMDLILSRRGAANLRLGAADAAAPVAQTLSVQSVVAGTTDTAGANLTITGSQSTGTGAAGNIIFQTSSAAAASANTQNALATILTLGPNTLTGTQAISLMDMAQTWNTSGTPTAIRLNVTDTASNASSLLMDLQTGGTSQFRVQKNGDALVTSTAFIGASAQVGATAQLRWNGRGIFTSPTAGEIQLGAADTTGTTAPTAQTLSVQSWASSTNNNQAGANFTITGSQGTGTGAGGNIIFQLAPASGVSGTTQNALTNVMTLWPTGQAVIGANNLAAALYNTSADDLIASSDTGSSQLRLVSASATTTEGGWLVFTRTAGGSLTSPTATASGATIGNILFQGYDGTTRRSGAQISAITGGLYSGTSSPAYLAFYTTASGSVTLTERLRIDSTGAWGLSGANYGSTQQAILSNGSSTAPTWQSVELLGKSAINTQTGTAYTLALTDQGSIVEMNNAAANTVTVPPNSSVAFPTGARVDIVQYGAGQTTVSPGAGVTIRSNAGKTKTSAQYVGLTLYKRATDEWVLVGSLA